MHPNIVMKSNSKDFWITNISDRDVLLADLGVNVKARSSINLLDKKHYYYSEEMLEKSYTSGSLYKKRNRLFKRAVPPVTFQNNIQMDSSAVIPSKTRSIFEIKEERIPELEFTDEQYTAESGEEDPVVKK